MHEQKRMMSYSTSTYTTKSHETLIRRNEFENVYNTNVLYSTVKGYMSNYCGTCALIRLYHIWHQLCKETNY